MITKQAYLNLAAVDDGIAAELEKVAFGLGGFGQRVRSGLDWLKGKMGPKPAPSPYVEPPHPNMGPMLDPNRMRRRVAARNAVRDFGNAVDGGIRKGVGHVGTFLSNAVTGGQARAGLNQVRRGIGAPGKTPLNQKMVNEGLVNMAAGAGKTGLLYGGLGYGGYRMLRNDGSDAPVARMYHQAMPY